MSTGAMRGRADQDGQLVIDVPRSAAELSEVKALFQAYMRSLRIDLSFQQADEEMQQFPNAYRSLLLARRAGQIVGAVALKQLDPTRCEMKRLYCRPSARGLGAGRALALAIVVEARKLRYRSMRLDTFPSMTPAIALYESMGFVRIPAYYDNPYPDAIYFELALTADEVRAAGGGGRNPVHGNA